MDKLLGLGMAAAALILGGCAKQESSTGVAPATEEAASSESAVTVLQLTGNDQMKFDLNRLEAKAGAVVRVVLTNIGSLPKVAMGHNFVLLKKGVDPLEFSTAAATAQANDYIPPGRTGDILAYTRLIGPKEKAEVTFTAPSEPGEYTYVCTFPGHFAAGMKGVLVVQ